jgi:hypothetical protein
MVTKVPKRETPRDSLLSRESRDPVMLDYSPSLQSMSPCSMKRYQQLYTQATAIYIVIYDHGGEGTHSHSWCYRLHVLSPLVPCQAVMSPSTADSNPEVALRYLNY